MNILDVKIIKIYPENKGISHQDYESRNHRAEQEQQPYRQNSIYVYLAPAVIRMDDPGNGRWAVKLQALQVPVPGINAGMKGVLARGSGAEIQIRLVQERA